MTPTRGAKTRPDTGELTKKQRIARAREAAIFAKSEVVVQPPKWEKRGIQPEVTPQATAAKTLRRLAAEIREEFDPAEKARLQAQYDKIESEAGHDDESPKERDLRLAVSEIVQTFAPIIAKDSADHAQKTLEMPEAMTRTEWLAFHKRLITCRHQSGRWITRSRSFAMERWGMSFVVDSETQMELALGLEDQRQDKQEAKPRLSTGSIEITTTEAMVAKFTRLSRTDPATWPAESVAKVAEMLRPIAEFAERIRSILDGQAEKS